jgi:SecY interacting protein Syd
MSSSNPMTSNKTTMSAHLTQSLIALSENYIIAHQEKTGALPLVEFDEDWHSPCEQERVDDNVRWKPVQIEGNKTLSFDNVEQALNIKLHDDIKTYFTTIYSESIDTVCEEGALSLLFAWNEDDFSRLQENLIGHVLMKQKLKQEITLFFAVTDEEDIIISVLNENGEVWVERVGCKPHKKIANSLSEFIETLHF